ncbi:MAG: GIY-YIG nuclease family protein [Burkholderiales bacterium]|jgi:hypothetical protein|nr:GIY-YIG nuclease family protein [Burkholderiales bacterium]
MEKQPFYVYALKDPREKPAKPFYIGKGTGNRAWEHTLAPDDSEKGKVIKEIQKNGLKTIHTVLVDGLAEEQALKIEAELIAAFGIRSQGGLLTNVVRPITEGIYKKVRINVPSGCYERAQCGLNLLKDAVIELAKANSSGITNSDVSKFLGLQSDYCGGSKDYLSFSVLGVLMKERKIKREDGSKKHLLTNARS